MEVILREDVAKLGRPGDVVRVKDGYARNFLLPRGLAVEANQRNLRAFEHEKRLAMRRREAKKQFALQQKEKLDALALTLTVRAGEEGRLFGSVTNIDIERALRDHGIEVDRRKIMLPEPIKQLGEFTVVIKVDPEVEATLRLKVAAL
jgi:large subunit ribosomal protein L9